MEVSPRAKVVVNERTGTVVIGGNVGLQPVSILHGGLSGEHCQPVSRCRNRMPLLGNEPDSAADNVEARDKPVNRIELKDGATVDDLVQKPATDRGVGAGDRSRSCRR